MPPKSIDCFLRGTTVYIWNKFFRSVISREARDLVRIATMQEVPQKIHQMSQESKSCIVKCNKMFKNDLPTVRDIGSSPFLPAVVNHVYDGDCATTGTAPQRVLRHVRERATTGTVPRRGTAPIHQNEIDFLVTVRSYVHVIYHTTANCKLNFCVLEALLVVTLRSLILVRFLRVAHSPVMSQFPVIFVTI